MMGRSVETLGAWLDVLARSNHFLQRQVALVLMEVRDSRARGALESLVRGAHGASGVAGLTLGKLPPTSESLSALTALLSDAQAEWRRMGMLALGRMGGEGAGTALRGLPKTLRQDLDREAALLGLGWCGQGLDAGHLGSFLKDPSEDVKRAAATALGYLGLPALAEMLTACADGDPSTRIAGLSGIARLPVQETLGERLSKLRTRHGVVAALEEARWVLAIGAHLNPEEKAQRAKAWAQHKDHEVRAAAVALLFQGPSKALHQLVHDGLEDPSEEVRLVALLAVIADARTKGSPLILLPYIGSSDHRMRRAAVLGTAYLGESNSTERLKALLDPSFKDDVRTLAQELLALRSRDAGASSLFARAGLQVMLDETRCAVSWNLNTHSHERLLRILDLENAIPRGGGGASPSGSAGARSAGAAATRPSPEDEDLRRHFDRFPYMELRPFSEFP